MRQRLVKNDGVPVLLPWLLAVVVALFVSNRYIPAVAEPYKLGGALLFLWAAFAAGKKN